MIDYLVRPEGSADISGIRKLHQLAFSGEGEARLVDELRKRSEVIYSLIADQAGKLVGHALFSRIDAPMRSLALGPVAVYSNMRDRGIGSALTNSGLELARDAGWEAIFVLGDPKYYSRFGFHVDTARGFLCPYSGDHFMALPLRGVIPRAGRLGYPAPWSALG